MSPTSPRVSALPRVPEREIGVETVPSAPVHRAQIVMRFAPLILALIGLVKWSLGSISGSTMAAAAGGCLVAWLLALNGPSQVSRRSPSSRC